MITERSGWPQILMATCHNGYNPSFPKVVGTLTFSDKRNNKVIMIVGRQFSVGFLHFCTSEHRHWKLLFQTIFSKLHSKQTWETERMSFSRADGRFVSAQNNKDNNSLKAKVWADLNVTPSKYWGFLWFDFFGYYANLLLMQNLPRPPHIVPSEHEGQGK